MGLKQLTSGTQARGGSRQYPNIVATTACRDSHHGQHSQLLIEHRVGGGLELPLACHFRLAASEGARIGLPELDLGTVPAWGRHRPADPDGRASSRARHDPASKEGRRPKALAIGLVHELHPIAELKARAIALAEELAAQPPIAVAGVLRAVLGAEHLSLEDALRIERDAVRRCSSSADQSEGMTAFLEKRRPRFGGR